MSDPAYASSGEYNRLKYPKNSLPRKNDFKKLGKKSRLDGKTKIKQKIVGNSMYPKLRRGDEIITELDSPIDDRRVGDIITFINYNRDGTESFYTHEVIGVRKSATGAPQLITKGANNKNPDPYYVTSENYIGNIEYSYTPYADVP